ncbi:MAG: urea ABC transporter substrate-binding protein [Planctomycetia bacterium]|nr:urea ABC transporter substrate-binding protein [Planctomycetia bacterium]
MTLCPAPPPRPTRRSVIGSGCAATLPPPRPTRRSVIGSGCAATLVAARRLGPLLFAGCGSLPAGRVLPVGLLHSQTGPLAISATPVRDAQIHAVEQINAAGGLLGRPVEFRAPDPRSRPNLFATRARDLLEAGAVALFGCWTTPSRLAVLPLVEEFQKLLFYAVPYEGGEASRFIVYGGQIPNQQVLPALEWLQSVAGGLRRRVFVVGNDDRYGRLIGYLVGRWLEGRVLRPVGQTFLPVTLSDFRDTVALIRDSDADCVLNTLSGNTSVSLFAALAAAGLDSRRLPVVSTTIGEDELRNLRPDQVEGHFATSAYFQTDPGTVNAAWVEGFRREFGFDRVTSDTMETGYALVHLWADAVRRAGSVATTAVIQALRDGRGFDGPGGRLAMDPATQHCAKPCRLGRIRSDRQFTLVHESPAPIAPDPFPAAAFPGWSCDWTQAGLVRGAEVKLDGDL